MKRLGMAVACGVLGLLVASGPAEARGSKPPPVRESPPVPKPPADAVTVHEIDSRVCYRGVARNGMFGPYLSDPTAWPPSVWLDGGARLTDAELDKWMVATGTLRTRMIGSSNPRMQIPRQRTYFLSPYTLAGVPESETVFDATAARIVLKDSVGGDWRILDDGGLRGTGPWTAAAASYVVWVLPRPYSDPAGRDAAEKACAGSQAGFRIMGSAANCTALVSPSNANWQFVRQLRRVLRFAPVRRRPTPAEARRARGEDTPFAVTRLDTVLLTAEELEPLGLAPLAGEDPVRRFGSWVRGRGNRRVVGYLHEASDGRFFVAACKFPSAADANAGFREYISTCSAGFPIAYHAHTGDKMWGGALAVKDNLVFLARHEGGGDGWRVTHAELLRAQLEKVDRLASRPKEEIARRLKAGKAFLAARGLLAPLKSRAAIARDLEAFLAKHSPSPWDAEAHLARAQALERLGRRSQALAEYELLARRFPKFAGVKWARPDVLARIEGLRKGSQRPR